MRVLIVGGGPSGLACAESILTHNPSADVLVVDKSFPSECRPQRCAGGISAWMAEKVGLTIPEGVIEAKVRRVRIYSPDMNFWEFYGPKDYGYVVNRNRFERWMAERAERLGARIIWFYEMSKEAIYFKQPLSFIVGADGVNSTVRKWLNLPTPSSYDLHLCVQIETEWKEYPQDQINLYFGNQIAPEGYAWIFPSEKGKVKIGLGTSLSQVYQGHNPHLLLKNFIEKIECPLGQYQLIARLIPTAPPMKSAVYGKVLLVGDAGLWCDPATGGGIMQGIASGKAAGRAIAEGKPELYDKHISWLRKQNNRRYRLKRVLCSLNDQELNDLVQLMQGFKLKTMSVATELNRAITYLLLRKPRLLGKFFKAL